MHIAIIGNGISGVTTALRVRSRQPDWRISLISGESEYFFSRPALMYIFMGHMTEAQTRPYEPHVWDLNRIERVQGWVSHVDTQARRLEFSDGRAPMAYDKLVIATGSAPNKFGWPGQDLDGVHGMYSLQDLYALEANAHRIKRGVIVGGGLIGIELAEMLHARGIPVTLLARERSYWSNVLPLEESGMVNRHIHEQQGIDLRLETELAEIVDDGRGRVCAVVTKDGERIECQFVGLTAGVRPNLSALAGADIPTGRGVLVDWQLKTEIEDVYAVGDCAELVNPEGRNTIEQVWYTGKAQGEVLGDVICGLDRTYTQGIWYNSAKFLDLEWQTYGQVNQGLRDERSLFWGHPSGRHSMRLVFQGGVIKGVNAMGIRYRHRVCERWIAEGRDAEYVFKHMPEANFDPEFYRKHEAAIVGAFMEQI